MSRPIYDEARSQRLRQQRFISTHKCSVSGCSERVARPKFMCKAHWFQVPLTIRNEVWAAHCAKPFDRDCSLRACADAIRSVPPVGGVQP